MQNLKETATSIATRALTATVMNLKNEITVQKEKDILEEEDEKCVEYMVAKAIEKSASPQNDDFSTTGHSSDEEEPVLEQPDLIRQSGRNGLAAVRVGAVAVPGRPSPAPTNHRLRRYGSAGSTGSGALPMATTTSPGAALPVAATVNQVIGNAELVTDDDYDVEGQIVVIRPNNNDDNNNNNNDSNQDPSSTSTAAVEANDTFQEEYRRNSTKTITLSRERFLLILSVIAIFFVIAIIVTALSLQRPVVIEVGSDD